MSRFGRSSRVRLGLLAVFLAYVNGGIAAPKGDASASQSATGGSRVQRVATRSAVKLIPGAVLGRPSFGFGVALSADGTTALIGGPDDDHHVGSAWVFTRAGTRWIQNGRLTGDAASREMFGWSVALSADGRTAVVGAPGSAWSPLRGTAWVFVWSGGR
jgi:hypothetical protein